MKLSHELKVEASIEALIRKLNSERGMITSCEFNIDTGSVRVIERDGSWRVSYMGVTYTEFKKDIVLEVFDKENGKDTFISSGLYLAQKQKRVDSSSDGEIVSHYTYEDVKRAKHINGEIINGKWVIEE